MRTSPEDQDPVAPRPSLDAARTLAVILAASALAAGAHAGLRTLTGAPAIVLDPDLEGTATLPAESASHTSQEPRQKPALDPEPQPSPGIGNDESGDGNGAIEADLADRVISLETAAALHERSQRSGSGVWFLDARRVDEHARAHVAGALSMPSNRITGGDGVFALMDAGAQPADLFVIYCTGGDCDTSELTAEMLDIAGYPNSVVMEDGFDAWAEAGLPVERASGEGTP